MRSRFNRRRFLKVSAAAIGTFSIVPRHVLGGPGYVPPSEQLTRGIIGCGWAYDSAGHKSANYARLLGLCDVDNAFLAAAMEGRPKEVTAYHDFREMLARPDIDVIHVVTPPHWHGLMALAAAESGKDIWCEKPMTLTIGEGQALVEACRRNGTILRINTWFRFSDTFYGSGISVKDMRKVVENRVLGWPLTVVISGHTGFDWKIGAWSGRTNATPEAVPEGFDYDFWLGPAPWKPYTRHRTHRSFRGYWDYDGGGLGDMGLHYLDPVQYFLDKDQTSPVKIEADTDPQHPDAARAWRRVVYTYDDGCRIILDGDNSMAGSPYVEGPEGKIFKGMESDVPDIRRTVAALPDPQPMVTDFVQAVRQRRKFALNEVNGHRSTTLVNLGKIAVRLNRTLNFDAERQCFIGDDTANQLISPPMRAPWSV